MNKKLIGKSVGLFPLVAVVLVMLFFGQIWVRPWPDIPVYKGESRFSGDAAYQYLRELVTQFPHREAGTEKGRASAQWVADQFRRMGLKTSIEEFESYGPHPDLAMELSLNEPSDREFRTLSRVTAREAFAKYKGYNVVGVSPGKTSEQIIIGAHRDVFGTVEGAEDDGSGTAVMMELVKSLSARPHYYTYVFISYDVEEVGLLGSANYAQRHRRDPIILSVALDMTGHKDASCIWIYQYVTGRGSAPLWTLALARSVMQAENLPMYFFEAPSPGFPPAANIEGVPVSFTKLEEPEARGPVQVFFKTLGQRSSGQWWTDSGSFIERGIPAVGFTAVPFDPGTGKVKGTPIHTPDDNMSLISADVLGMSGRFVERYVESVNLNAGKLGGTLGSRYFTRLIQGYLSPFAIHAFSLFAFALVVSVPVLRWMALQEEERRDFRKYVGEEKAFLALSFALALFGAGVLQLCRLKMFWEVPILKMLLISIFTPLIGTILLAVIRCVLGWIRRRRNASATKADASSADATDASAANANVTNDDAANADSPLISGEKREAGAKEIGVRAKTVLPYRRLLVDVVLVAIFLVESLTLNFFVALTSVGIPLLFVNMLNITRGWKKVLHVLALLIWSIDHLGGSIDALMPYGFALGAPQVFLIMFFNQAVWTLVWVYSFGPDGPMQGRTNTL